MKILILSGSPHVKGTTALLRDSFIEGSISAGHTVNVFDAAHEEIHPCLGCNHCLTASNKCVYKDGMEKLNPLLLEADCVVFVTPLYYFGMSAQLKLVIDRFFANNTQLRSQKKLAVLLAACGDKDEWAMDALVSHYQTILHYLHWEDAGSVLSYGMYVREDIENSNYPQLAKELGKSL